MTSIKELYKTADFKSEKHVPVIEGPDSAKKGEAVEIAISVGKEIAHPNTTEHHISWIEAYYVPEGAKVAYRLGRFEFSAHGASAEGPNTIGLHTVPKAVVSLKAENPGTLIATSYCNIHGLWESAKALAVE